MPCIRSATWLLLALLLPFATAADVSTANLEYRVKAAYLYNFTKFVTWPDDSLDSSPNTPLNICILGEDPFGRSINMLSDKLARGHKVVVSYLQELNGIHCQVMFISRSEADRLQEILSRLASRHVLTVSDIEGFAVKGGCIRLDIVDGKVRFNINMRAARQAELQLSAKLLELAKMVIE